MNHITFSYKSFLLGDEAADLLTQYAVLLAQHQTADLVKLNAFDQDGNEVVVRLVLGSGVSLMSETTHSKQPEPENIAALSYMRAQTERLLPAGPAVPFDDSGADSARLDHHDL